MSRSTLPGDSHVAPTHVPVLKSAVLAFLGSVEGTFIDCTIGLAGHSRMLLEANPRLNIIGLDADAANLEIARANLRSFEGRFRLIHENFAAIEDVLRTMNVAGVAGILADLGVSSNQIADSAKGLSFDVDGPLDMRLDSRLEVTAADLVNSLSEGELSDLLYFQSQERHSRIIARRICQVRRQGRINSTLMLARLVAAALGEHPESHPGRIHPATRTFQALRIAVNHEIDSLRSLLASAPKVLRPGGRIAVISFHSGEDRIVKEDFKARAASGVYRILTKKPVIAEDQERESNPRSRSAKLRVAEMAK